MAFRVIEKPSKRVPQDLLRTLIALSNSRKKLDMEIDRLRSEILKSLLDGAEVDPGVHMAYLQDEIDGGVLVRRLVVN